ncbi:hypothetical protein KKA77_03075 [Patescibacteria group bacterium]|nr:hypothetical protein [Patescibacteria group bacterium]MBU2250525.1 hypothetical protein [Patescibacteria group bacterium]
MFKKNIKNFLIVCLLVLVVVSVVVFFRSKTNIIQAEDVNNKLTGWAYGSNIGWISMNSANCDVNPNNDLIDTDIQTPGCAGNDSAKVIDYGVRIDNSNGNFSGFAWSEMNGWIYFGPDATLLVGPDKTLLVSNLIQISNAPSEPRTWAKFDKATGAVTGWAKILSAGDDGWIKMSDDNIASWENNGVKIATTTGDLSGWAWNGDSTNVGWISFKSDSPVIYKVNYPIFASPAAPSNVVATNYPESKRYIITVGWENSSPNIVASTVEYKKSSAPDTEWSDFCSVIAGVFACSKSFDPNTTYDFRVKVTDKNSNDSAWVPILLHNTSFCAPDVSLDASGCNGVTISWTQLGYGITSYDVYRKVGSEEFLISTSTPGNIYTYNDTGIELEKIYDYKVVAQPGDLESNVLLSIKPCHKPKMPRWKEVKPE